LKKHHGPVTFPWTRKERAEPERTPLSREQIVAAAIRIGDSEGLDALSMRRLGQELESGATSLYWHVRNKDELLDLVLDEIIGEVQAETKAADSWREQLAEIGRALRRVLLRHAALAQVMGERPTLGPKAIGALDWMIGVLRDAGFDPVRAALAANTIVNWSAGFAVFEARDPIVGPTVSEQDRARYVEEIAKMFASLPADRYPNAVALAPLIGELKSEDQFEYGLQRMLDGIEADLRAST
jgi:AcrR family transcriptional regulator